MDDIFANIQEFCNGWLRYGLSNTFFNCVFNTGAESLEKHRVSFTCEPNFIVTIMLAEVGTSERRRKDVHAQTKKQKNNSKSSWVFTRWMTHKQHVRNTANKISTPNVRYFKIPLIKKTLCRNKKILTIAWRNLETTRSEHR